MKCPQCATLVTVLPGELAKCTNCGFQAVAPGASASSVKDAPSSSKAAPEPEGPEAVKSPSMWAFLSSVVGLGTFFLAAFVLPFVFAVIGIGLGFWAHLQNRSDHRGMIAMVVGILALVACAGFLAV